MTIGRASLIPGERNTTPIKWTIRVWKSSWLKQLYAWCKCVVMLWFVARNTLIVHSERLLPSVMRQWQFLIPHESMMWFVIVHLLVGTPWVSWLLGDGLCLVFHLLSCQAHQICIILVFQLARLLSSVLPSRQMPHLLHSLHHAESSALLHTLTRWAMQIREGDCFSICASYRWMWVRGDSELHCLVCYYKPQSLVSPLL